MKKLVLRYSRFPSELIIIVNIILDYVGRIKYKDVRVQRSDIECTIIFSSLMVTFGNIKTQISRQVLIT